MSRRISNPMSFTTADHDRVILKGVEQLAREANAPRPHGVGISGEGEIDLDPARVIMVPAKKTLRASGIVVKTNGKSAPRVGVLGKFRRAYRSR